MPFCYSYNCPAGHEYDLIRSLEERNNPAPCPSCGKLGRKIITKVNFNEVFPGSTKHEFNVSNAVRMSVEAQDEGFRSTTELEEAEGQAHDRAKQLGIPVERILGGHKSPFKGDPFMPSKNDAEVHQQLSTKLAEAAVRGQGSRAKKVRNELKEHQNHLSAQAKNHKREFAPDKTRDQLKKEIKTARESRKGLGV